MLRVFASLRRQVLLVLILATLPLAALSVYLAVNDVRRDRAEAQEEAEATVRLVKRDIDRLLQSSSDLLIGFSRNPTLAREPECQSLLESLRPSFPQFANILVTGKDYRILCAARNPGNLRFIPHDAVHESAVADDTSAQSGFVIGNVVPGSIVHRPILPLMVAVPGHPAATGKFFEATIDLAWVDEQVNAIRLPNKAILLVMDRNGALVARNPPSPEWRIGQPAPPYEKTLAGLGDFNGEILGEGGVRRVYSVAHAGASGALLVAMKIRSEDIYAQARRRLFVHLTGLAVVALLVLTLTWLGTNRYFATPLLALIGEANRLAGGDLSARSGLPYTGELGGLARSLDEMADALQRETANTRATLAQNEEIVRKLRALTGRLQSVREEERTHIAREIHDELGQQLTAIRFDVVALRKALGELPPSAFPAEPLLGNVTELTSLVDSTIGSVRRIGTELRPRVLDTFGLVAAIEWQADDMEKRTHIQCVYEGPAELVVEPDLATTVFRICQESLTNIVRHSQATEALIRLQANGSSLSLEVIDNGRGIPAELPETGRSFGLLGMRERARMAGGTLEIDSQPGHGTTVIATFPISVPPREAS